MSISTSGALDALFNGVGTPAPDSNFGIHSMGSGEVEGSGSLWRRTEVLIRETLDTVTRNCLPVSYWVGIRQVGEKAASSLLGTPGWQDGTESADLERHDV